MTGRRLNDGVSRAVRGFTLVELVVALAVMSLLMLVLYDGLHLGMRTWDAGSRRVDRAEQLRRLEAFLRGQLARVHLPVGAAQLNEGTLSFRGDASGMAFTGRMPGRTGRGAFYGFDIRVEGGGDAKRLAVRYAMAEIYSGVDSAMPETRREILIERTGGVRFEYFGLDEQGQWRWTTRWTRKRALPTLVRMRIEPATASERSWPVLLFRVREGDYWVPTVRAS